MNEDRLTLKQLADEIGAEIVGGPDAGSIVMDSCASLEDAGPGQVGFVSNPKYLKQLASTKASAVIVATGAILPAGTTNTLLRAKDPYYAFALAVVRLHGYRQHPHVGIHPAAHVDPSASIGPNATIYPGVFVGPRVKVGRDCILYPNAVVYDDCVLGDRVILHAGAVIGADGYGYATHKDPDGVYRHHKIPQIGIVEIGDDVEVGANTTIDRAAMGKTIVARGTKVDNLVAIGHGTKIGEHSLLVAQSGIAGSTTTGHHMTIAGQAGVAGHLKLGNAVTIAAKAGVMTDLPDQSTVMGLPAIPASQARRVVSLTLQLPDLLDRIKKLEQAVSELADTGDEIDQTPEAK